MVLTCSEKGYGSIDFKKLGANIAELRNNFDISQEKLSEKLKVSRKTVSDWETGKKRPTLDNLAALCDLFHCEMDYLLGKTDFPTKEIDVVCSYTGMSQKTIKKIHKAAIQKDNSSYITDCRLNLFLSDLLDNYPDFENLLIQLELFMMSGTMSFYAKKNPKATGAPLHEKRNNQENELSLLHLTHFAQSIKDKCLNDKYILNRLFATPMSRLFISESLNNTKK